RSSGRPTEDEDVFVADQQHALDRSGALVVELEEARPQREPVPFQAAEERDLARAEAQAVLPGERDQPAGQVNERTLFAIGAHGEHETAMPRVKHAGAAGEDL